MTDRPPVTLLLPNRNNERVIELTLQRLEEHTTYPDFELVVVDDGSTDGGLEILRRWRDSGRFREFTLIELEHGGVVTALNTGLEAASGALIVQLDGDATVETSGWLERMVDFQRSDARIGVVTPLVTFENGAIHAAGINLVSELGLHDRGTEPIEAPGSRTFHTRVKRLRPDEAGDLVSRVAEVDCSLGVQMLYPREMAREIGGYDPEFSPVWFDDLDLSLSARKLGLKAFFIPGVHVLHRTRLREDRTERSSASKARQRLRSSVAGAVPDRLRRKVRDREQQNTTYRPHELKRIRHHYTYWREKWGWDLINPDVDAINARYGDTELCWAYDPARRAAGEEIAAAWVASPAADTMSS